MFESNAMDAGAAAGQPRLGSTELSIVDAVLWACELSEDETEVGDLVESALRRPDVQVTREPTAGTEADARAVLSPNL